VDSWQEKDIPISNFKITAEPDILTGEIKIITEIAGKIKEQYLQTFDDQVRNALIDLGWTPPPAVVSKKSACDKATSDMTPCFLKDGDSALSDRGFCVGCGYIFRAP